MTKLIPLLGLLALAACNGNDAHPLAAPTGIRAESGGGVQQLNQVPGVNASASNAGVISRTRVQ